MTQAKGNKALSDGVPPPVRRKRRWLWLAVVVLAFAIGLTAFAPAILSAGLGLKPLLAYAGDQIGSRLTADELHLSWFGKQEVSGLGLDTAGGAKVARVSYASVDQGLWGLIWSRDRVGAIAVRDADVHVEGLNEIRLAEAGQKPVPEAPKPGEPGEPPTLPLAVQIRGLKLHAGGAAINVTEANFQTAAAGDTFDAVVEVTHKQRTGTTSLRGTLEGLSSDWKGWEALGLKAQTQTKDLPLAAIYQVLAALDIAVEGDGTLSGNAQVTRSRDGKTTVGTVCSAANVWLAGNALKGDRVALDELGLAANLTYTGDTLHVESLKLESDIAAAQAKGTFVLSRGKEKEAATASGTGSFRLELAPLARMLPNTLGLHKDLVVQKGRLEASAVASQAADTATIQLTADVKDLSGTREGKPVALSPVHVEADLAIDGQGLLARQMTATGAFGQIQGQGRMTDFRLNANLLLDKATQEVGQFLDLKGHAAGGTVTASLQTKGSVRDGVRLDASADLADFSLRTADKKAWKEPKASLVVQADLKFDKQEELVGADVTDAQLRGAAGAVRGTASAQKQAGQWNFKAAANGKGNLAPLARQVADYMGNPEAPPVSGQWSLEANADGTLGKTTNATVKATTAGLAYAAANANDAEAGRAPPKAVGDATLDANLTLTTGEKTTDVSVRKLRMDGPGVTVDANGKVTSGNGPDAALVADGTADARFDLGQMLGLLRSFGIVAPGSRLAGTVTTTARAKSQGKTIDGTASVIAQNVDVYLAETETTVREPKASLPLTFAYATDKRRLTFALDNLESRTASGRVKGAATLAEKHTDVEMETDLTVDGPSLRGLLGNRIPAELKLADAWRMTAQVAGPMPNDEGLTWNRRLAALAGQGRIAIGTFTFRGMKGEQGEILWKLAEGKLVPSADKQKPSNLTINHGTVALAGQVELDQDPPRYRLAEATRVVNGVEMTGELAEEVLVYVSPLLGHTVTPTGRLMVNISEVDIPLDATIKQKGVLKGDLVVEDFKTRFKAPFSLLTEWVGVRNETVQQTFGPSPIHYEDGVFHLSDQKVMLAKGVDFRLDGTVAADGNMKLMVGVPLTESLVRRAGLPGGSKGVPADAVVRVPLKGTVSQPRLDEGALLGAVAQTIRDIYLKDGKGIGDVLGDILKKRDKPKPESPPEEPKEKPQPDKPRSPLGDLIDIFR